jgi:hypothetical protein
MTAAKGSPAPNVFHSTRTSGTTPSHSNANIVPVRPIPVCASSRISTTLRSTHCFFRAVAGEIWIASLNAYPRRDERSGGRTGHDRVHGKIDGHTGRHHAAIPLHYEKLVAQPRTA